MFNGYEIILSGSAFLEDDKSSDPHGLCALANCTTESNAALKARIASLVGEHVWVTSLEAELHVANIRNLLDTSCTLGSFNVLHNLLGKSGWDNPDLLKTLFGLGVDPNAKTALSWTPGHLVGCSVRPKSLRILGDVRPDLYGVHEGGMTPVQCALLGWGWLGGDGEEVQAVRQQMVSDWVS